MSTQRAARVEETPVIRTTFSSNGRASATCIALCDDGSSWVSFNGGWMDHVGIDGVVMQRVPLVAPAVALAARPDGSVTAICRARRDVWGRVMPASLVIDVQRDGTLSEPTALAVGPYFTELLVDATGTTYASCGAPLYSINAGVAASVLPYWVSQPRLVPSINELWAQTGYYIARVADLTAVARGAMRGPAPGISAYHPGYEFIGYAPRKDGQAWLAMLEQKSVDRSLIRRMNLGSIDYTKPRPALAELKIAADIYSICAARDGGYFALGSDGVLRRADPEGALEYELPLATPVSTRLRQRLRVRSLVLSRDEQFAAGLDVIDGALLRVKLPASKR